MIDHVCLAIAYYLYVMFQLYLIVEIKMLYSVFANNWGEILLLILNNSVQLIKVFVIRYFIAVVFIVLILYYNYLLVLQQ